MLCSNATIHIPSSPNAATLHYLAVAVPNIYTSGCVKDIPRYLGVNISRADVLNANIFRGVRRRRETVDAFERNAVVTPGSPLEVWISEK
jgi:hypothetical protein